MQSISLSKNPVFKGDDSGATKLYITLHNNSAVSSISLPEVLAYRHKNKLPVTANPHAVIYLLHNSLIPTPLTAYAGVYVLGMGDRLRFPAGNPLGEPEFWCEFPYFQTSSTEASVPSTKTLLELLCKSVESRVPGSAALMMSSGKDSVSLALALHETGLAAKAEAFTYADASQLSDEASDAARFAKKLGLKHTTIAFPDDPKKVKEALLNFFTHASYPSCDPTTIPYAVCLYHAGVAKTHIIDGTRNDTYMGIVPSPDYQKLCKYYELIGGGFSTFKSLRALMPFYHKGVKFLSTYPEVNLYKHGHLRAGETSRFFPSHIDTEAFWLNLYRSSKSLSMVDMRTLIIGQYFDGCSVTAKAATVADSLHSQSVIPWADQAIASYYFNLPEGERYNRQTLTNKVLVRKMLAEYLEYDAAAIGKRIFYFDMQNFVRSNLDFIREEITACKLWQPSIHQEVQRYLSLVQHQPRAAGAIIDLFMTSGWHNHSKYLHA